MQKNNINNIYYLGPNGSNTYYAAIKFLERENLTSLNKLPQKSIKSAAENFENDINSLCILPIENSIEGIVRETLDNFLTLKDNSIQIQGEITIPINHMLLSNAKNKKDIKKIYSHPQALAQCGNYLYKNFPDAELKEVSSTGYAAQKVSTETDSAAIANITCSDIFNLNIVAENINDEKGNQTRFYILGRNSDNNLNMGKTALMLSTKNQHGALCSVLQIFAKYNINLSCIESRPSKKKLGEYVFFMELDGFKEETNIKKSLTEIKNNAEFVKILGSFKEYKCS